MKRNNLKKYTIVNQYISNRWDKALKKISNPEYPLPNPFVPPCVDGEFQCLFYWDTFFLNRGMILDNKIQYAIWNTDNLISLLDKYGFVPNSNSYPGIKHNSQPPFLQYMVRDIYEATKDDIWLKKAYFALKKEYTFWMQKRMTPIGLNQYLYHEKTDEEKIEFYQYACTRLVKLDKNAPREFQIRAGASFNCSCESGLDLSPTMMFDGEDIVEVDLNSHLYNMEGYLAQLAKRFETTMEISFLNAQKRRKELMDQYMLCQEDNLYWDFNFKKNNFQQRDFHFAGQFMPFVSNITNNKEALRNLLQKLEYEFGVSETEKYDFENEHQCAYPYSWPFDNAFAFWALTKVGLDKDAERIGMKYLSMCLTSFELSGHLWETYDATKSGIAEKKEYPNTEMLGWTAGIYQWIYSYLFKNTRFSF